MLLLRITLLLATLALPASAAIKVLIVDGYSNHDWPRNTQRLRGLLAANPEFHVTVSTAPNLADAPGWPTWRPRFADYDVVIQTCNDIPGGSNGSTPGPQWPKAVQTDFENYIANGGGTYIYHGANNAFPNWPAYNQIIGLGWRPAGFGRAISLSEQGELKIHAPGDGDKTGHGPRLNTVVHRRGEHPIHRGLPAQWMAAELEVYFFARGPAQNIEILSYALDPKTKLYWPVEWTVQYGKGRVYSSTNGHFWKDQADPPNLNDVAFQTILPRVIQWLAKREVTSPVPPDFPSKTEPSLRLPFVTGQDLSAWTATKNNKTRDPLDPGTAPRFSANDGILTVHPGPEKAQQRLSTKRDFPGNFELRLEFRAEFNADSGLFLRGPQLQVRDYLLAGPYKTLKNYKPQDWNEIVVTVKDNLAHATCNGELLEAALPIPANGPIGFEADRGQMEYRNIRLIPLP